MKKHKVLVYIFVPVILGLFSLLGWNCYQMYLSERSRVQDKVELCIKGAADAIQNYNGSLLNNMARMLIDDAYSDKVAFAAGFTHNQGKMVKYFFDDDQPPPPDPNNKPIIVDTAYLHKEKVTYKPSAVMGIPQFDSVFRLKLREQQLSIPYSVHRSSRTDSAHRDSIVSSQFILDFATPKIYSVHYFLPKLPVLRNMIGYLGATLLVCGLMIAGAIFYYRGFNLQMQLSQFRESLVSNITHELKTPLSSLQLIVDEAQKEANGKEQVLISAKHVAFAASETSRMKLIVDRALSFSKMSRGELAFNKERMSMDKLIEDAISVMEFTAQQCNGSISYEGKTGALIDGDPVLLVNAVSAVIDNALKYSGDSPAVDIKILQQGRGAVIAISDNGPGIPKQFRKKIFEPFFRIPTGNVYNAGGHGLGLSMVKQVVSLHGGDVSFTNGREGTTFYLKFSS